MEFCVHNYIEDTRLAKLTSLQEKFLKHTMNSFPNAKRIVYSTCSLFPEENERVITNVVKTSRAKWRVQDVKELLKGQWNNFGSGMYGSMGTRCLYARPDTDLTTGFFLAVLDRDQKDIDKSKCAKAESFKEDIQYNESGIDSNVHNNDGICLEQSVIKKNKKRKHKEIEVALEPTEGFSEDINVDGEYKSKKKKKKKKYDNVSETDNTFHELNIDENQEVMSKSDNEQKEALPKKKKTEGSLVGDVTDNSANLEEITSVGKKKKKKKNSEKTLEKVNVECNPDLIYKKSKKKKHEISVNESFAIEINDDEKNKKKKRKMKTPDKI